MIRRLLAPLATLAILWAGPAAADTLLENVQGVTIGEDDRLETFNALLIDDEGRIRQVYERGDKRPRDVEYQIDGKGRYVIPGLIDAHVHVMDIGFGELTLDLSDTTSLQQAQDRLRAYAAAHPERKWIIGHGWNQELWGLGRFPTAAELDAVVPDRPVWLERIDGHAGWANSAAMAAAGITAGTKSPPGGRIEMAAGRPSGVFVDAARSLIESAVPKPQPADRDFALAKAQDKLLALGVTAVADMGTSIEDWQSYRRAGDAGWLKIRIMAYAEGTDAMELIGGPGPTQWLYDDRLRLNGVKLYVDGALGSRGALLKQPYADDPGNRGLARATQAQLRNWMSRAALDKFQVAIHAIGDVANAEALSAIAEMSDTYTGDRRWRIEHAQVVDPADIAKFGEHGIIASMQPLHQTSDRQMAEKRLGSSRLAGAYAWNSIAATGAKLAFGSDAPVESPNPFAGLAVAMTREDANGEPFGGWQPQERVSREAALKGFTSDAAYAGFAEGRFGRMVPGERADFLIIDRDPLLVSPAELRAAKVLETWVGGRQVYRATEGPEGR
jgi:predicted amidohydrolase YtcJ